jgi:hypothetical protein
MYSFWVVWLFSYHLIGWPQIAALRAKSHLIQGRVHAYTTYTFYRGLGLRGSGGQGAQEEEKTVARAIVPKRRKGKKIEKKEEKEKKKKKKRERKGKKETKIEKKDIHHSDSGHRFPMSHLSTSRRVDMSGGDRASASRGPKPSHLITYGYSFHTSARLPVGKHQVGGYIWKDGHTE